MAKGVVLRSVVINTAVRAGWMLTISERCVENLALSKHSVRLWIGR